MEAPLKVIIADDHRLFRESVKMLVESSPDYKVIAEAADARSLLTIMMTEKPDLLISDYHFPDGTITDILPTITRTMDSMRVVILTDGLGSEHLYQQLIDMSVAKILLKESSMDEILSALKKESTQQRLYQ
ncbi:response regulator transcription factor [Oceanicoccus sp. KOV_DT_Chl]|uniref:response regulator n=1 Tax=Oceanicoccus sp. KOV_DT_Chl TaxID=1904639 RepID=UPI000C7DEA12|nr:response regulator transcription factor [Oceanicoccus sp. KOV_DT_Chl]